MEFAHSRRFMPFLCLPITHMPFLGVKKQGSPRALPPLSVWAICFILLADVSCPPEPLHAKDYFLSIGGGYAPEGNQASLEANVLFLNELLSRAPSSSARHSIFFANGNTSAPDMQALAPRGKMTEAIQLYADLYEHDLQRVIYRSHRIPHVQGRNHAQDIEKEIDRLAETAAKNDRLFIYVTAHGGRGSRENAFDTTIHGWNDSSIRVHDLAKWLDRLPHDLPVIMVMTQCYSGGFSHAIFQDGNSENGLANALRCGFFGQRHDLMAAGCRNDVEDDQEYSSYFWGAFSGRTRSGQSLKNADCNGDGLVSLAEAHACALTRCNTIDVPVRATEALLRVYSALEAEPDALEPLPRFAGSLQSWADQSPPDQRRVILDLSADLQISVNTDISEMAARVQKEREKYRQARRGRRTDDRRLDEARTLLLEEVEKRWPELDDVSDPASCRLLTAEAAEFLRDIRELPGYTDFSQALAKKKERSANTLQAELNWVKHRRLQQAVETVVLANNLPLLASAEIVTQYRTMLALEESTLLPQEVSAASSKSSAPVRRLASPRPSGNQGFQN